MIDYITITQKIKDTLLLEPFINKVTKGNLDDIANAKREEYGLAHIIMNNCTPSKSALTYNVSIICMDIVDIAKEETTDSFVGNSNEDFVLNLLFLVIRTSLNKLSASHLKQNLRLNYQQKNL